jgi:hypothetical protein
MGSNIESLAYDPRLQLEEPGPPLEEPGPPIQALPQQLAGTQQAPAQQLPWYRNLMQNLGGIVTKPNVIPSMAGAASLANALGGSRNTPFDKFTKTVQDMAGGLSVGSNLSPNKMAAPPMQSPVSTPIAATVKATGDIDGDGKITINDIKMQRSQTQPAQAPAQSRIDTTFSPGGYNNLPGVLGQGPTKQSFSDGSGVSTGNPESVVNVPVGNATPDERAYALALLAGNPDVGVPGVMKYALDSGTLDVNKRNAEAQLIEANVKNKLYPSQIAKNQFEIDPVAQMDMERFKAAGKSIGEQDIVDNFADTELGKQPIPKQWYDKIPGLKPGMTMGDIAKRSGGMKGILDYTKLYADTIKADNDNLNALKVAGIRAGGDEKLANSQALIALGQHRLLLQGMLNNVTNQKLRLGSQQEILLMPTGPERDKRFADLKSLEAREAYLTRTLDSVGASLGSFQPAGVKGEASVPKPSPKVGSEVTVKLNGKKVKAKVVGSGVVEYNGKKYNIK